MYLLYEHLTVLINDPSNYFRLQKQLHSKLKSPILPVLSNDIFGIIRCQFIKSENFELWPTWYKCLISRPPTGGDLSSCVSPLFYRRQMSQKLQRPVELTLSGGEGPRRCIIEPQPLLPSQSPQRHNLSAILLLMYKYTKEWYINTRIQNTQIKTHIYNCTTHHNARALSQLYLD